MKRDGEPRTHHYEPTARAQAALGTIDKGYRRTLVSHGQWGLGDALRVVVDQLQPCSVLVSCGFVSVLDAQSLGALLGCGALTDLLLLTDRGLATKHPRSARAIEDAFGLDRVRVSRLKARFAVVRGSLSVVVRGSGSLAKAKGLDLYDIDVDNDLATFIEETVESLVGEMPAGWGSTPEVDRALAGGGVGTPTFDAGALRF